MTNNTNPQLEKLVLSLKSDSRFTILKEDKPEAFGEGVDYWEVTEFESDNLKVLYGKEILMGTIAGEEIVIIDKKREVYVYSNSPYLPSNEVEHAQFSIGELEEYLNRHA